jgi:accessory gene regulator protein AgrB
MMMILLFTFASLFVIVAILTFFRNVLLAMIAGVIGIFRKNKKDTPNEPKVRRSTKRKKKIYADNEGEYVDYEEVK